MCSTMFRCVEWLRCILTSFCDAPLLPTEEWYKLLLRFNQLISAEDELYSLCQRIPEYLKIVAPAAKVGCYNTVTSKRNHIYSISNIKPLENSRIYLTYACRETCVKQEQGFCIKHSRLNCRGECWVRGSSTGRHCCNLRYPSPVGSMLVL
jgi:hypothetical protein